ncbi:MAG TPA: ABC transporter ATP-binding protein [Anaerolineales bacterium]|nr:ABC transporter ATP-binding protein [Anaerolineales bacterium]
MLRIRSISVSYGEIEILHELSLDVNTGEVVSLIGPNGAGKTTMMRAISGVIPVKSGSVHVDDEDLSVTPIAERARLLAVVPQARKLPPEYTVQQSVLMGRTPYLGWLGNPSPGDIEKVQWAIDRTRLSELANRRVDELSGGEQQLVLVARALAQDAPVMLLDEPTAHLDLRHQTTILDLVHNLARERGLAVLMSLHDLNLVSIFSDRIALLDDGNILAVGKPKEVINQQYLSKVYQVPLDIIPHPHRDIPIVLLNGHDD